MIIYSDKKTKKKTKNNQILNKKEMCACVFVVVSFLDDRIKVIEQKYARW